MPKGFVSLIGAGPGDRELISLKGWRRLSEADIVFYDYLVNERLLNACSEECECVYVGKSANQHHYTQEKINAALLKAAQEGKQVVRLKGGDPFVFGRGSEELLLLHEAGISFEVVPGITAAVAGPAYAGVPLTHRDMSLSCTFITGHESKDKENERTDWNNLADNLNTLIFYMGMKNLKNISSKLIANGRSEDTPCLVVQNGSMGIQQTLSADLKNIADEVKKAKLTSPALIVVGSVTDLRKSLQWFEKLPFFGRTLAFVGSFCSYESDLDLLETQGARVLELPLFASTGEARPPRFRAHMLIERAELEFLAFENLAAYESFKELYKDSLSTKWLSQFVLGSYDKNVITAIKEDWQCEAQEIKSLAIFLIQEN